MYKFAVMVKNSLIVGILSVSLFACESVEQPTEKSAKTDVSGKSTEVVEVPVIANRVLTMELEGMVCSMGCGGSIRKELKATGAVSDCDFDFEDERAIDIATIQFDKNKITADKIIEIVSKINDGQFTVGKTSSEGIETTVTKESQTSSHKSTKPKFEAVSSSFDVPNLFDLFSGLLN
jgi:hypothetical protein